MVGLLYAEKFLKILRLEIFKLTASSKAWLDIKDTLGEAFNN